MIDDVFRDRMRALADIDHATQLHLTRIGQLAERRKLIIIELVDVARKQSIPAPQQHVARMLGISQQTVSKIINRK